MKLADPSTAASSQYSVKKDKTSTKSTARLLPAMPVDDVLQMLSSAVAYCIAAGLKVGAGNGTGPNEGALIIKVNGAQVEREDGVTRFVPLPQETETEE